MEKHPLSRAGSASRWVLVALSLIVVAAVAGDIAYAQFPVQLAGYNDLLSNWLYNAGLVAAGLIPLVQVMRGKGRWAVHGFFGLAILAWAAGDIYWWLALSKLDTPPFPSFADAGYLAFYPPVYIALILVIRARVVRFIPSVWLDGLIAVLTCAAAATALVISPILSEVGGTLAQVATNVAYPIGDLLLILLVLLVVSLGGWRIDRQLAVVACGLVTFAIADSVYLYRIAAGTYHDGTLLDALWIIGVALLAFSSLFEFRHKVSGHYEGWAVAVVPAVFALGALGILAYGAIVSVPLAVPLLAVAALLVAFVRAALTYRDVQSLVDARKQATTDELTGLPNRRWLVGALGRLTQSTEAVPGALTIIDLNRFKEINDTLGHQVGDAVLHQVGARLLAAVDGQGQVARLGGDEFAILTESLADATACAERIERAFAEGFPVDGLTLSVSASMGAAVCFEHASDIGGLLRCADVALYDAKRTKSPFAVYNPSSDHHSIDNLLLTSDLRAAIADEELTLVYQPKVSLESGAVVGVEALARWDHPVRGHIPPMEFVALAEAGGLMQSLTRLVLQTALRQTRAWLDAGDELTVAVNISASDLIDTNFHTTIEQLLDEHDVPAHLLQLEITETELISDSGRTMATIDVLTAMGVRIALDDFGTGYSSLQYLHDLCVDELKIDRGFITNMTSKASDAAIVRCAIEMAKSLTMTVVAEGVEDQGVADLLTEYGCDQAQGYDISRPLTPTDLDAWLRERRGALV